MNETQLDIFTIMLHSSIVVKFVLGLLAFASIYSWAIIIKKRRMMKKVFKNNLEFMRFYKSSESLRDVMIKCEFLPFSPYRSLFMSGYTELTKFQETFKKKNPKGNIETHFHNFGLGIIERGLQKGFNETNVQLDSLLSILASIGSVTPFIGLFGTVWGIIDSFTGIASGGATLDAVAPGIAEALVATAAGLAAAIPAVWFYNSYSNKNSVINAGMESFGQDFLNVIESQV